MTVLKDKYKLLTCWWRSLNISDDAALAEAFNGTLLILPIIQAILKTQMLLTMIQEKYLSMTA